MAESVTFKDYSLVGLRSAAAIQQGLAGGHWYRSPVDKQDMREFFRRRDWPAVRDTPIWFALLGTDRPASFWYGARSLRDVFYRDYFENLMSAHPNFRYHLVLSEPATEDGWTGHTGFVHQVLLNQYLCHHLDPASIEYYLCGPPAMLQLTRQLLGELSVPSDHILFDEF